MQDTGRDIACPLAGLFVPARCSTSASGFMVAPSDEIRQGGDPPTNIRRALTKSM